MSLKGIPRKNPAVAAALKALRDHPNLSVIDVCQTFDVSRSGVYRALNRSAWPARCPHCSQLLPRDSGHVS